MPRWAEITLTLVLFAAAMAGVGWIVRQTVPSFSAWLGVTFGENAATSAVFVLLGVAAVYGFWPRNPDGSFRSLSRRA